MFVDAINVDSNKVVFSADDRVLVKLLRQQKMYDVTSLSQTFPTIHGHCQD